MSHLIRVDQQDSSPLRQTSMHSEGLLETEHLERWIIKHPEVIDPGLMVVTTQFGRWASAQDSARERPDVLALSDSGELVVMELKRGADRQVHLQAITYGALVAGFTKDVLAQAHAEWVTRQTGEAITKDEALKRLSDHVEADWSESLFTQPRLVLVAEDFPGQVLTTVQWLASIAPDLTLECHEYHLFKDGAGGLCVNFQRLFPVEDLEDRTLRPSAEAAVREQIVTNKRRAKSVTVIHELALIPPGSTITLELETLVKPEVVATVYEWLNEDRRRRDVRWVDDPSRPLTWAAADDAMQRWTPSALRNEIFKRAGQQGAFSAADAWCYQGENLYGLASKGIDSASGG